MRFPTSRVSTEGVYCFDIDVANMFWALVCLLLMWYIVNSLLDSLPPAFLCGNFNAKRIQSMNASKEIARSFATSRIRLVRPARLAFQISSCGIRKSTKKTNVQYVGLKIDKAVVRCNFLSFFRESFPFSWCKNPLWIWSKWSKSATIVHSYQPHRMWIYRMRNIKKSVDDTSRDATRHCKWMNSRITEYNLQQTTAQTAIAIILNTN